MTPLSLSEASRLPHAPSQPYLTKLKKRRPRPAFFVDLGDGWEIDVDHPGFRELLEKRAARQKEKHPEKPVKDLSTVLEDIQKAKRQKLREQIRGLRIANERAELELQRQSASLIDVSLCERLFTGYLERLQGARTPMTERLQTELENLLASEMIPGADPRSIAKRISRRIVEAEESIIHTTKLETAQDVEDWDGSGGMPE